MKDTSTIKFGIACGLAALAVACTSETGGANLVVSADALSASDIATVRVTATPPGSTHELIRNVQGQWVTDPNDPIDDLPIGLVTFEAEAADGDGTVIFSGTGSTVITAGETSTLVIFLQQVDSTVVPFQNRAPVIDALILSQTFTTPGGTIEMVAAAHDDDSDPITFTWTSSGGATITQDPNDPTRATFTAPTNVDPQGESFPVTLVVDDGRGARDGVTVSVLVGSELIGDAEIDIDINGWPEFEAVPFAASDWHLEVGESAVLQVFVTDPEGDPLTVTWVNDTGRDDPNGPADNDLNPRLCVGTFSNGNGDRDDEGTEITFTLESPDAPLAGGPCVLTANISDGRGGSNRATVVLSQGASSNGIFPLLSNFEQNATSNSAGAGGSEELGGTPNGIAHDGQEAGCRTDAATEARIRHLMDDSSNGSRIMGFNFDIQDNPNDDCVEFASVFFPLQLDLAQDLSRYRNVRFDVRSLGGGDIDYEVEVRTADNNEDCKSIGSIVQTASDSWQEVTIPFSAFENGPTCDGTTFDITKVGSLSFKVEGIGSGTLGLDNIEFIR